MDRWTDLFDLERLGGKAVESVPSAAGNPWSRMRAFLAMVLGVFAEKIAKGSPGTRLLRF